MSERSIQLVGKSTFIVSLPKEWALAHGLGPKSKVLLTQMPNGILAISPEISTPRGATLVIGEDPDLAVKLVVAAYLNGYDALTIKSSKNELPESVRLAVRRAINRLVGFEVLHQTPLTLEIELAAEPKVLPIESGLTRMSLLVESALNLGLGSRMGKVAADLDEIDEDSDRLNFMYIRRLRQGLTNPPASASDNLDPLSIFDLLTVFRILERCVDHAVAFSKAWGDGMDTIEGGGMDKIRNVAYVTMDMLKSAILAFIRKDVAKCTEISKKRALMRKGEFVELEGIRGANPLLIYHISRLVDYSADIVETVLNEGYGFIR